MSQYPAGYNPQYSFWPYYHATPQQLLAPARTSGWLLLSLGTLLILLSSCVGAVLYALPDAEMEKMLQQAAQQQPEIRPFEMTPNFFRVMYGTLMGIVGVYGLILLPVGILVRRGSLATIIVGLILTILPLLLVAGMFLLSLASGVQGVLGFICLAGIPALLLIGATMFLFRAAGNVSKIAQSEQQMQAMYQQQMHQYYQERADS